MTEFEGRAHQKLTKRQQRDILGTLFLALSLLMAFALYAPPHWTGWLGRALSTVNSGLFGSTALILPLILLVFALMFFLQRMVAVTAKQAGALFLIFLIATSLVSLFVLPYRQLASAIRPAAQGELAGLHLIRELWRFGRFPDAIQAGNRLSGGLAGGLIAHSLERVAGLTGTLIILFALLVTLLVSAFGLSPSRMAGWFSRREETLLPDPLEDPIEEGAAVPGSTSPGFLARLFKGGAKAADSGEEPVTAAGEEHLASTTVGPRGWETLYSDADGMNGSAAADRIEFHKPPPGYQSAVGEPGRDRSLQGVPYLFKPPAAVPPMDPPFEESGVREELSGSGIRAPEFLRKQDRPVQAQRKPVRPGRSEQLSLLTDYRPPPLSLLKEDSGMKKTAQEIKEIQELGRKLEETLDSFGVDARIVNYTTGPTITRFELAPGPGIKVSRIVNLSDDIALSLAAMGVRIEAPIPGKAAIGIEIPNKKMSPVLLRSLLESRDYQKARGPLVAALGRDVAGDAILCDISKMPHLLIAGATGSGKSVCINSILVSILYRSSPAQVRMLMIDPKIVELNVYNGIPHLLQPVVTNAEKAYGVLNYACTEMERRYRLFAEVKVRDIDSYNQAIRRGRKKDAEDESLPHILIVIDELADLMALTQHQVESAISRLMAKARAVGIHVIIATQRPSVDVITGVIKANIPSRVAFAVASQVDSRTIIDSGGAEKLLGRGDMLYFPIGSIKAIRGQGSFVSNQEVERVLGFIKIYYPENYDDKVADAIENPAGEEQASMDENGEDELLMEALRVVVEADYAAVSLLQRKLQVGYPRAARLVDRLSELGYVGPFEGSKPRKLLITRDQYDRLSPETLSKDGDDSLG